MGIKSSGWGGEGILFYRRSLQDGEVVFRAERESSGGQGSLLRPSSEQRVFRARTGYLELFMMEFFRVGR